ncbi:uncharacterized protein [Spinacia oleracea]|uniref:DUF4283 domain-containing protein n=1 Tax=Spinacia oleracea TaxID=3562 RepID=A0A9R0JLL0_SPIOL|nr:uncharacterized protein LOC110778605 [Spinacia oleracea]
MQSVHRSANKVNNTPSNVDIGTISIPILQQFDEVMTEHADSVDDKFRPPDHIEMHPVSSPVQIDLDDIQDEVDFWNSSIICYIIGANPPIHVMEGFIRRIWKKFNVDKVVLVKKGIYLVRFLTMDMRDKVTSGHFFFDSKPMIVKPWSVDMDTEKEEIKSLGKPIKRDATTVSRDKLQYARVLVDMPITQNLPDKVSFMNEHGELVQVPITYEWRPTVCDNCKLVGHSTIECRKGKTKRIWVQKKQQVQNHTEVVAPEVDQEGFQRSLRLIRVRPTNLVPTPVDNSFQMLNDDGGHGACSTAELDREDDIEEGSTGRGNSSKSYG